MLEVREDAKLGKYVITPLSNKPELDYMILCTSENEAKTLIFQITMGMVKSPVENPLLYLSVGIHPNGHTKMYQIKLNA
jgi:hypothetical protein